MTSLIDPTKPEQGHATTQSVRDNFAKAKQEIEALQSQDLTLQPLDATLSAMSGVTTAADTGIYFTGVDTAASYTLTAAGRALLDDANAAAQRTTLGLVVGTDVQAQDAELQALSGLTSAANQLPYFTGSGTAALASFTAAGRALVDDADATAQRATLGLVIGTDVQAQDAELSAIAGLVSAADRLPYFTGSGTAALATFTAAGRALVDDVDATAQRATLGLVIGTNVQAQDAELQAIAGLASAADQVPYFTGSGTAALATFTAAGRALVDDADATAQRATLGLGTAATYNIGTSGAVVPILSQANSWSGYQKMASGLGASAAPGGQVSLDFNTYDSPRWVLFKGGTPESGGNVGSDLGLASYSDSGSFIGVAISARRADGSVIIGSPSGGYKGAGTINAVAVYDDNVLLTCYIFEAELTGAVDLDKWDAITPNRVIPGRPAQTAERPVTAPVTVTRRRHDPVKNQVIEEAVTEQVQVYDTVPVVNDKGVQLRDKGVPVTTQVPRMATVEIAPAVPEKVEVRTHGPAARFAARAEMMLDPKQYGEFWKANGHLPSMPSPDEWVAADHKLSTGDLIQRLWEVVEVQSVHMEKLRARVEALEALQSK